MPPTPIPVCSVKVLIATVFEGTGAALAELLGDPPDICFEVVGLAGELPLNLLVALPYTVDVVLLDLEPWPAKILVSVAGMKACASPPLVWALAHGVDTHIRQQCSDSGVDDVFDRTADLVRLHEVLRAHARHCTKPIGPGGNAV